MNEHYYTPEDYNEISQAKSFVDLRKVAEKIIKRIPSPVVQVCGPISTGGKGDIEANMHRFRNAIKYLRSMGLNIFYQLDFEPTLRNQIEVHRPQ